ncbi:MAG: hypothetical protein Alpg2KO_32550 [Alphaproteobacteria bacterium]
MSDDAKAKLIAAIEELEAQKAEMTATIDAEIAGLKTALGIIGGKVPARRKTKKAAKAEDGKPMKKAPAGRRPRGGRTIKELVLEILKMDKGSDDGMKPRMIADRAADTFDEPVKKASLNQALTTLKKEGKIDNSNGGWRIL